MGQQTSIGPAPSFEPGFKTGTASLFGTAPTSAGRSGRGSSTDRRTADLLAVAAVFIAYAITIRLALSLGLVECLLGALANTVPVVLFGYAVRHVVARHLSDCSTPTLFAMHLGMCVVYSMLSYGVLIVLLGLFNGSSGSGIQVRPLSASGTAWQTLENITTYALIAAVAHLQTSAASLHRRIEDQTAQVDPRTPTMEGADFALPGSQPHAASRTATAAAGPAATPAAERAPSRYFVRIGDELRPLDTDQVVSIGGADDYAEIRTTEGSHLVRMTLAEFERSLDPAAFVRVHRSWIVNTHRITRAEPAGGGRLLLHLDNGQRVTTSRDGARRLRDRVI